MLTVSYLWQTTAESMTERERDDFVKIINDACFILEKINSFPPLHY
jgi:hypothetical protein